MARLFEKYKNEIVPKLMDQFGFKNRLQTPHLEKIVINMGIGAGIQDAKLVENAARELAIVAGQGPVITRARKSIAGFKVRKGQAVGCKVTLRGVRMYEFLDRFISVAVPRVRDFRGFPPNSFDNNANYSFGLDEQTIFPEIDLDKVHRVQGMDITIVSSTNNKEQMKGLLNAFGFPFAKQQENNI